MRTTAALDPITKGEVGMYFAGGQVVLTASGRKTSPFPSVSFDTNRKAINTLKRVDAWLVENALEEARARGDDFNELQFRSCDLKNLSQCDKDSAEEYLFGYQPPVVASPLRLL